MSLGTRIISKSRIDLAIEIESKKKIGKRSLFVYWIDIMVESHITDKKIFEPSFTLRKLKSRLSDKSFQTLSESVKLQLVPFYKDNAQPIEAFESALINEKKINELKSSASYPREKVIVKLKPEIEVARKKEKEVWKFAHSEFDKLDRKLIKKFGCKVDRRIHFPDNNLDF
jgi:hypothetical protein